MLNTAKGPAVHSLRAQADKYAYQETMTKTLQTQEHLGVKQLLVERLLVEDGQAVGVVSQTGAVYRAKAVILTTGTYLRGRVIIGEYTEECGPNGQLSAKYLSQDLAAHGLKVVRFKTGTPARVDRRSVDFDKMSRQDGDEDDLFFSFETKEKNGLPTEPCWLTIYQ